MTLRELRQRLSDLKAEGNKILDAADKAERELTDDEETKFQAIEGQIGETEEAIVNAEQLAERRQRMEPLQGSSALTPARNTMAMDNTPEGYCGFRDLADFALAVHRASPGPQQVSVDERFQHVQQAAQEIHGAPTNFHQETGTTEGYMVPPQMRDDIWDMVFENDNLLPLTDVEPTSGNSVSQPHDEDTPWDANGVIARWRSEGTQMVADKLTTSDTQLKLHELYAFVLATEELLEDAPRLNNRLTRKSAEAIGWKIDDVLPWGTGVGQPLGWMNSGAAVTVAKEGGQAADTIVALNVINMFSRMLMFNLGRTFWMVNSDTLPQLMTMTVGDSPIWLPPNGLAAAPGGFLLGRPVRFSEHNRTLGDRGDMMFVDPKGYYAARKASGIKFASSMHLFFDFNIQAFRWTFRLAGQPHLSKPVTPPNSANTKSFFVTLAERA